MECGGLFGEWCAGGKTEAPKAPLCKGSCREATEGLCSKTFLARLGIGEKGPQRALSVLTMGTYGSPPLQPLSQLRCQLPLHFGSPCRVPHRPAYHSPNSSANSIFPQRQKKAGPRQKRARRAPAGYGNIPQPFDKRLRCFPHLRGTLLTPFTCHTQSGRSHAGKYSVGFKV